MAKIEVKEEIEVTITLNGNEARALYYSIDVNSAVNDESLTPEEGRLAREIDRDLAEVLRSKYIIG